MHELYFVVETEKWEKDCTFCQILNHKPLLFGRFWKLNAFFSVLQRALLCALVICERFVLVVL